MQAVSPSRPEALFLSTQQQPAHLRHDWLQETISQEYTHVAIRASRQTPLFNEMTIYPWQQMRLSIIHSNGITIQRRPGECGHSSQDAYFAVILLAGQYQLEQHGREAFLQPGDMALYDATRAHHIHSPGAFSKLIVSIPRPLLRGQLAGVEHCTARRIVGTEGMPAIGTGFIRSVAQHANGLGQQAFNQLAPQALELLAASLAQSCPGDIKIGRSRSASLHRVKRYIEAHLHETGLDMRAIVDGTGLSSRYITSLFTDDDMSPMRHVWQRRLEKCRQALLAPAQHHQDIAQIAYQWGFSDQAHFSRSFKQAFGLSPRAYRASKTLSFSTT